MDILILLFGIFCVLLAVVVAVAVGNVEFRGCYRDKVKEPPASDIDQSK
ncbi:hypothetical protein KS4_28970 [Poriferisphaera corsica]|uniref:Uncharacterized protein n=1 Tax=Poriferisphaera corsica TaxID=2528020 RepID=A0A517YX80_9BACT|nr:hypothetical protein [Poriferisphaera corsica]QDU34821.1 hypothetical protein KS4_28970 [Poriferisphaera corsica]